MSGMDALKAMAEGNPGAVSVLMNILNNAEKIDPQNMMGGLGFILDLDSLQLYGSHIWMLYRDVCQENISLTLGVLRCWQMGFLSDRELKQAVEGKVLLNVEDLMNQLQRRLPSFVISRPPSAVMKTVKPTASPVVVTPGYRTIGNKERKWFAARKAANRLCSRQGQCDVMSAKATRRLRYWMGVQDRNIGPWATT